MGERKGREERSGDQYVTDRVVTQPC